MIIWDNKSFVLFTRLVKGLPFCDKMIIDVFSEMVDEYEFHSLILPKYMVEPLASSEDLYFINLVDSDDIILLDWVFVSNLTFKLSTYFASTFFQEDVVKPKLRIVKWKLHFI